MKKASVVIGSNFGDEGKGLVTDFLAAPFGKDGLVVRFNGGAQAGHTVTTPEGQRHIFSHFGCGSFAGVPTFLSRFFICNPILFLKEYEALQGKAGKPLVFADALAQVSTPYDMMINQIIEEVRGTNRHGSCGVGVGETVERNNHSTYAFSLGDLFDSPHIGDTLGLIRNEWVPMRLKALGIEKLSSEWKERIFSEAILAKFMEDTQKFRSLIHTVSSDFLKQAANVVFEGAQGLLLDQDKGWFPHVTRSNTGIKNAAILAEEAGIEELDVHYITRAYATRHGAGPLPHEETHAPIPDETNKHNRWQGNLRFAQLDLDLLGNTVREDFAGVPSSVKASLTLAVTCLDQVDKQHKFVHEAVAQKESIETFLVKAAQSVGANRLLLSHGPTRKTLTALSANL